MNAPSDAVRGSEPSRRDSVRLPRRLVSEQDHAALMNATMGEKLKESGGGGKSALRKNFGQQNVLRMPRKPLPVLKGRVGCSRVKWKKLTNGQHEERAELMLWIFIWSTFFLFAY